MWQRAGRFSVEPRRAECAGVPIYEYAITGVTSFWSVLGFGVTSPLEDKSARLLARFFERITMASERILLAFSPLLDEDWQRISHSQWTTLVSVPQRDGGLGWVIGYTQTTEKLAELLRFAWSRNFGDPVVLVVAPAKDEGRFLTRDVGEGDESVLAELYPVVAARAWQGARLNIASARLTPEAVVAHLRAAAAPEQEVSVELAEQASTTGI